LPSDIIDRNEKESFELYKNVDRDELLIDLLREREGLPVKNDLNEIRKSFEKWHPKRKRNKFH